jgi:SagB-type dehydrogenase family enzyme
MRKYKELNQLLNRPSTSAEKFQKETRNSSFTGSKNSKMIKSQSYAYQRKSYYRLPQILLNKPKKYYSKELIKIIKKRVSFRNFLAKSITLEMISNILFYGCGIKQNSKNNRYYPSAGALYPLETYLITQRVKNLPIGLYHYYVPGHSLELINPKINSKLINNSFAQDWIIDSSLIIIITAVFKRVVQKYGERGYRYVYLEAGHLMQNLFLLATKFNFGFCPIGGYYEKELEDLIDIDGFNEAVIYTAALGHKE